MRRGMMLLAIMAIAAAVLFAASDAELYRKFSEAASGGDADAAIRYYSELQDRTSRALERAGRDYSRAIGSGSEAAVMAARSDYLGIERYPMTEADTDNLLSAILKEDGDKAVEHAKWLYSNSSYYYPTITYEWNADGDAFSYSYFRSVTVLPGSTVILPSAEDIGIDSSSAGVLEGWGITPDEVTYEVGERINAPIAGQTLYAIWKSEVRFTDPLTGERTVIDDISTGDSVEIPEPRSPGDGYIFAGWEDESTGTYLPPDAGEYVLEGNGASFKALWKKLEVSDLKGMGCDASSLPTASPAILSFSVINAGTEDLRSIDVEVEGSEGLAVLAGSGRISFMRGMSSLSMTGLSVVAEEGGKHTLTVTLTDRDGDSWKGSFDVYAE